MPAVALPRDRSRAYMNVARNRKDTRTNPPLRVQGAGSHLSGVYMSLPLFHMEQTSSRACSGIPDRDLDRELRRVYSAGSGQLVPKPIRGAPPPPGRRMRHRSAVPDRLGGQPVRGVSPAAASTVSI
jgi:hypothetical protein